ncbi:VOC family protein [Chelatococcus sp. SYSU_G07232]|uniref:VOC family protein n=1 Tax=Chelatococcus albus TaxID=3047466 RepID=A0ABT7AKF7_9HYPH|nr:VOC family protein [Chelatococcus sp. SYSU_G07232]MDJ1159855.1 VOC family protein [Chelatococcus sp. SYSU_G07232]
MFSHVTIGTNDLDAAVAFYDTVLATLGLRRRFHEPESGWVGYEVAQEGRGPLICIGRPFDGAPAAPGNGVTIAFNAARRDEVDAFHAAALAAGGMDEGAPGLRAHYHPDFYGAYVRDPAGNKLCCVCHAPA